MYHIFVNSVQLINISCGHILLFKGGDMVDKYLGIGLESGLLMDDNTVFVQQGDGIGMLVIHLAATAVIDPQQGRDLAHRIGVAMQQ